MFRMRRYRIFVLVAALSGASLYYLVSTQQASLPDVARFSFSYSTAKKPPTDHFAQSPSFEFQPDSPPGLVTHPPVDSDENTNPFPVTTSSNKVQSTIDDSLLYTTTTTAALEAETITGEDLLVDTTDSDDELKLISEGAKEADRSLGIIPQAHWEPHKEHNPVAPGDLIKLPRGLPKPSPKVQHDFSPETNNEKSDRLRKLVAIREAFKHAWEGYKKYALPHDELWPISKSYGDSFMGWGATLIDSLDSLWILDFKEDFEMAVNETANIDFRTSYRKEIPLFETVIRILGGLVSAYDVSEGRYPILLEKAQELAEILMGAFDTPNRMPDTYYKWAPSYASQNHRAPTRVVLAELGSLSMEFTRLAQITQRDKYYDAVARVQHALEEWQMDTDMPGLWPLLLDASGCRKSDKVKVQSESAGDSEKPILIGSGHYEEKQVPKFGAPAPAEPATAPRRKTFDKHPVGAKRQADDNTFDRALSSEPKIAIDPISNTKETTDDSEDPYCQRQGLNYEPYAKTHRYAIGGQADSTYEYMPKMHRLLGGLTSQYELMYKSAAKVIREKILYRPMIKEETRQILFAATLEFDVTKKIASKRVRTTWEATHLGCFAGGMFALGAKTFGIPTDLEIARQLTDGCVWAYESTTTKIMPERFALTPCDDAMSCPWDEKKWHEALDPKLKERMNAVDAWNKEQKKLYQQTGANVVKEPKHMEGLPKAQPTPLKKPEEALEEFPSEPRDLLDKRDPPVNEAPTKASSHIYEDGEPPLAEQFGFRPKVAMSHERYVKARIQEERLPPSYTKIYDRSYILRPEAIESVFIMWRITGEEYWRQKGWVMFQAIQEATHTEVGNAELEDVTSILGEKKDKMESFWLAETLKYFYLLFSEPNVVSLDDFVL
ncbi:hypothetical protein R6Q59_010139 [Mikania micrantha]